MKKGNLIKILLAFAMTVCFFPVNQTFANSTVQTVQEGSRIALEEGVQTKTLTELLSANLEDWYEVGGLRATKVQEGVLHIDDATAENPAGFNSKYKGGINNCSSMYLIIDDNEAILIDGGNGVNLSVNITFNENLRTILDELVFNANRELQVIIAHKHGDHIGAFTVDTVIPEGTPMYIHEDDYAGIPKVTAIYEVDTFKQGDVLGTKNFKMKVIDIPGHTDGSCALINYDREIIFTDDALGSGTVYLGDSNTIYEFYFGVRNLWNAIKDMDNPILYAGHRWQQYSTNPGVSATTGTDLFKVSGEIGKNYVQEYVKLFEDILNNNYIENKAYGNGISFYSENSDLNNDGFVPGFMSRQGNDAVVEFIAKYNALHSKNTVVEGSDIALTEGKEVESLFALENADLEDWFEIGGLRVTKVQEGVLHIDEATAENPAGFNSKYKAGINNCSSMYIILDADEAILIDGGNGVNLSVNETFNEDLRNILDELVFDAYRELEVIIAHKHGDHVGAFTVDTVIPKGTPMYIHEDDYEGIPKVTAIYEVDTFKQGDVLGTMDFEMKVVDIPGHTDGSCALINYEREIIFTDDALGSSTVYLGKLESLEDFEYGVNNLWNAIKDMENPILYAGHRWQQYSTNPGVSATTGTELFEVSGEIGKQYVKEYVQLLKDMRNNEYVTNKNYGNGIGFFSTTSDLNGDGKVPGIKANEDAVKEFAGQADKNDDQINNDDNTQVNPPVDTKAPVKTGDNTNSVVWMAVATLALGGAIVAIKKAKKEDEA